MAEQGGSGASGSERRARQMLSKFREFVRTRRANSAVQFALVAAPLAALLVAIVQTAVVLLAQEVLQTATEQAARLIMTGQAQNEGMTASQFQQQICSHATALFNCTNMYVEVQTFANFSSVTMTNPIVNGQLSVNSLPYNPGNDGDIVVVQTYYPWPVVLAPLGFNLANLSGNKLLLVGTAAFRNEPF
jgi:Flp pilus assembly protein TadG